MQKDVIYIDTEDDITAIIGKVKAAEHHIVALVPPKRIGAIQSAVNLKLVHRAAEQVDKRLVIISNNAALMALAGSAGIPVAKNLQSKPELAEVPALEVDDGEDIIDGDSLPDPTAKDGTAVTEDAAADAVLADEAAKPLAKKTPSAAATTKASLGAAALAAKDKVRIPNFDSFRKKLFIGLGLLTLLIGFLVWALVFAPHATITVTARTSDAALNSQVKIGDALTTDLKAGTIKSVTKTSQKQVSQSFTATGKKDAGTKASGTVAFSTNNINNLGTTIPAGTTLSSSSGATYTTDSSVTMTLSNYNGASSGITASANGEKYNGATGTMTGAPSGISAKITSATSGGTDKTITVVQQSDVDSVMGNIVSQSDSDAAKQALKSQLGGENIVLDSSFKTDTNGVKPTPAVGAESSDGKGTLAGNIVFSIVGIKKSEAGTFLDAYFAQQIDGKANQKVYDNGLGAATFTNVNATDGGYTATISTNGKIGPKIDDNALKQYAKGKKFGDIQSYIQQINGVENVDVKFSPFWVTSAPNDANKIQVVFKVNGQ